MANGSLNFEAPSLVICISLTVKNLFFILSMLYHLYQSYLNAYLFIMHVFIKGSAETGYKVLAYTVLHVCPKSK